MSVSLFDCIVKTLACVQCMHACICSTFNAKMPNVIKVSAHKNSTQRISTAKVSRCSNEWEDGAKTERRRTKKTTKIVANVCISIGICQKMYKMQITWYWNANEKKNAFLRHAYVIIYTRTVSSDTNRISCVCVSALTTNTTFSPIYELNKAKTKRNKTRTTICVTIWH